MKRRQFNKLFTVASSGAIFTSSYSCNNFNKNGISLAQWSLNKMIREDMTLNPLDFAQKANELGFNAIEYVSTLYRLELKNISINELTAILKEKSELYGVKNLLIMVDDEGDLSSSDLKEINNAVDKHKKWVKMASELGCHSIRVNLSGEANLEKWKENSINGLTLLCDYASNFNINILSLIHI